MTPQLDRRALLRLGALTVLAAPAVAACTPTPTAPPPPDPLAALADAAAKDAATARAAAAKFPAVQAKFELIATNRDAQAVALRKEIDRATPPPTATTATTPSSPPQGTGYPDQAAAIAGLAASLGAAQDAATQVALTVPTYRAGLVGSVVAGCACLKELLS
ncbi:hypothetical protein [Kutzneria chonburiensis]|uniref:Uncharacterized protein n=1 Tax=Kutzneria chonburiensis TaxID=1483604 RepID=A0ABV6MZ83_9PSEU|nr:hypothetical protein [Kutzneria chonburiensis]